MLKLKLLMSLFILLLSFTLVSCNEEDDAGDSLEKAGENIEETVDDAGDEMSDVVEDAGDGIEDATD